MDIQKFNPWNWFRHEDEEAKTTLPIGRQRRDYASDPFQQLHQEIDRLFDHAFRGFGIPSARNTLLGEHETLFKPTVNISESEKEYSVAVEVPGVDEDDVKVELRDGQLSIRGEKKLEKENKDKNYTCIERSYGSFQRVLSLPEDIDENDIQAEFCKGVLHLTLPRKALPQSDVKRIDIKKVA